MQVVYADKELARSAGQWACDLTIRIDLSSSRL